MLARMGSLHAVVKNEMEKLLCKNLKGGVAGEMALWSKALGAHAEGPGPFPAHSSYSC